MELNQTTIIVICLAGILLLANVALNVYRQNQRAEKDLYPTNQGADTISATQQPAVGSDRGLEIQVQDMLQRGQKIEAIKLYRQFTGSGLREAKEAVESIERGFPMEKQDSPQADIESQIIALLKNNRKIEAVKLYRKATGLGLKEFKDAVDQIQQSL